MSKCVIKKKAKTDNTYIVTYELTKVEVFALKNGLEEYSSHSMVGGDVLHYTENAFIVSGIDK